MLSILWGIDCNQRNIEWNQLRGSEVCLLGEIPMRFLATRLITTSAYCSTKHKNHHCTIAGVITHSSHHYSVDQELPPWTLSPVPANPHCPTQKVQASLKSTWNHIKYCKLWVQYFSCKWLFELDVASRLTRYFLKIRLTLELCVKISYFDNRLIIRCKGALRRWHQF